MRNFLFGVFLGAVITSALAVQNKSSEEFTPIVGMRYLITYGMASGCTGVVTTPMTEWLRSDRPNIVYMQNIKCYDNKAIGSRHVHTQHLKDIFGVNCK